MKRSALIEQIRTKKSLLCVGLDTDMSKIPSHLLTDEDPVFAFNKEIIDQTRDLCIAYKPNLAFYEALGTKGWQALEKTIAYIGNQHLIIADAKRGDIGNTSNLYAKAFFESLQASAVTVAPYMGKDSVEPFLGFQDKWVILLALTSNKGSEDFQFGLQNNEMPLYEKVMRRAMEWASDEQLMFVTGATHPEKFKELRSIAPKYFFLVPGIGAQGGDLEGVLKNGLIPNDFGLIINSSREIIYASNQEDFGLKAREAALRMNEKIKQIVSFE